MSVGVQRSSYLEVAHLPLPERLAAMRVPARRAAILAEQSNAVADPKLAGFVEMLRGRIGNIFPMTLPLDYEPAPEKRLQALATAADKSPEEYLYDHYTADQGHNVCASFALNFAGGSLEPIRELLAHPLVVSGLGDGGAHVRMACDSALPTFQLTFWARDRQRGAKLPLPWVVEKLTRKNAELYGLTDRGVLAVGQAGGHQCHRSHASRHAYAAYDA
jgi:N-acyl-D-aspartate/D-glutamate deacylase